MHYYLQDHNVNLIFYANDFVIGSNNSEAVQNCLNDIAEYCLRNALRINVRKTEVVKFRKGGRLSKFDKLTVNSQEIKFVNSFEYLGIIFSSGFAFSHHLEHLKNKATKTIIHLDRSWILAKLVLTAPTSSWSLWFTLLLLMPLIFYEL